MSLASFQVQIFSSLFWYEHISVCASPWMWETRFHWGSNATLSNSPHLWRKEVVFLKYFLFRNNTVPWPASKILFMYSAIFKSCCFHTTLVLTWLRYSVVLFSHYVLSNRVSCLSNKVPNIISTHIYIYIYIHIIWNLLLWRLFRLSYSFMFFWFHFVSLYIWLCVLCASVYFCKLCIFIIIFKCFIVMFMYSYCYVRSVIFCILFQCVVLCIFFMWMCTVLYCTVLCCAVLCDAVLCCAVLCCVVLYCTVLYSTVLYCAVLYCTVLYCTV